MLNAEIDACYQTPGTTDILLGCILPWKEEAKKHIPGGGSEALMMDQRSTSCFVIKFGEPSELMARSLWEDHGTLAFTSSATLSGKGNSSRVKGIGERIITKPIWLSPPTSTSVQSSPGRIRRPEHEQGVMVSMVDLGGRGVDARLL